MVPTVLSIVSTDMLQEEAAVSCCNLMVRLTETEAMQEISFAQDTNANTVCHQILAS